jgi:hypothetical protein
MLSHSGRLARDRLGRARARLNNTGDFISSRHAGSGFGISIEKPLVLVFTGRRTGHRTKRRAAI